ncbi:hypothetical protein ACTFIT_005921 [Dictyostelium discoideum]
MVYLTKNEKSVIGSAFAAYVQRKNYLKIIKLEIKRREISKEIWSTEKYYNEQLNTIIELFLKPMMLICKQESVEGFQWTIKESDIHSIFSHIENIYGLSNILFEKIDPRLKQWSPEQGMGDIFVSLSPFFKCYKQYSENYSNSIETLKNLRTNTPQFNLWLKAREKDIRCKSLDLPSLLIAPIQRVPRYILLLEALYTATKPTHKDYHQCSLAATQLKNIAQVVNDGISEDQNRKKLIALQNIFDTHAKYLGPLTYPNLVEAHRKLIKEGKLQKKSLRDNSIQNRMVYLCNDILITISSITPLSGTTISKVDKIIPLVTAMTIFNSEDTTSFFLVSPIKTHYFVCESQQVRSQWLSEIQNAIVQLIENSLTLKAQRAQWELVYNDGNWKAISTLPNPDSSINVLNSFENNFKPSLNSSFDKQNNNNYNNNNIDNNNNNNRHQSNLNSSIDYNLSKSPDKSKFGSPNSNNQDEWRHGVPKLSNSKSSSSFLRSSSSTSPNSSSLSISSNGSSNNSGSNRNLNKSGSNNNNHNNNINNSNENSESEGEEYTL